MYPDSVKRIDEALEKTMYERFAPMVANFKGTNVLCVGARMGGEVRAFNRLGAMAIGIDFNPGPRNLFVLPGDAHNLQFSDGVFSHVFSNIVDHIIDVRAFFAEVYRVLRPAGRLWLDVHLGEPRMFEVRDLGKNLPKLERNASRWFSQLSKHMDTIGQLGTKKGLKHAQAAYVFGRREAQILE